MKVGDLIGSGSKGEIRLTADWDSARGQKIAVKARNANTADIVSLVDKLNGFYVYRISCDCEGRRSALPSVIKIGRSMNDLRQRLLSFPNNYSMNDVKLLKVFVFKKAIDAQKFETGVKRVLRARKIVPPAGYEWYSAEKEKDILKHIKEFRKSLKQSVPVSTGPPPGIPAAVGLIGV